MKETQISIFYSAAAQWPGIEMSERQFDMAWKLLLDSHEAPDKNFAPDFYLVLACSDKKPKALEQLRALIKAQIPCLRSLGLDSSNEEDLVSITFTHLVENSRLLAYSARAPLHSWLRTVMTNKAIDLVRKSSREVELDEVVLGDLATEGAPELEVLKKQFKGVFSTSFALAVKQLTPRQRNLLRQHHLDELSLEEMGALYSVHRATTARWLAEARVALLENTRKEVSVRMGIGTQEVDSIMRVVKSRLDISGSIFLRTGETR
jgi:RNA polymerase sigma-70 factor, ECF subfamily